MIIELIYLIDDANEVRRRHLLDLGLDQLLERGYKAVKTLLVIFLYKFIQVGL